ncbi:MAG: cobalt transporter [Lachnospiraceae bacterium]|nr:cobalt transporter [Lachnospiraceae bacterium]
MSENGHHHDHEHEHHHHEHHHDHEHGASTPEERMALLKYMLSHNAHHAEELHDLAHGENSEASALIHEAVECIEKSNEKLAKAIELLEKEDK